MRTKRTLFLLALAALAAVIFMLNKVASEHYYYWIYWWYDIMMHFLGGCLIGGLAAWGVLYVNVSTPLRKGIIWIIVAIAAVGIGWEFFEYFTGQYLGQTGIVFDTTLDLIMDLLGALVLGSLVHIGLASRQQITTETI